MRKSEKINVRPGLSADMTEEAIKRKQALVNTATQLCYGALTIEETNEIKIIINNGIRAGKTLEVIKTELREYLLEKGINEIKKKFTFLHSDEDLNEIRKILKAKTKNKLEKDIDIADIFNSINEYLRKKEISDSDIDKMRETLNHIIKRLELIERRYTSQIKEQIKKRNRQVVYDSDIDILIRYYISCEMNKDQAIAEIMNKDNNYDYITLQGLYENSMEEMEAFFDDFLKTELNKITSKNKHHIKSLITSFVDKSDDKYSNLDTGKCIIPEKKGNEGKQLTGNGIEILSSYFILYIKSKGIKIPGKRTDQFRSFMTNYPSNIRKNEAGRTKSEEGSTIVKTGTINGEPDAPGE